METFWLGFASVAAATVGQLFLARGMREMGPLSPGEALAATLRMAQSGWIMAGLALYVIGAFLWMVVLSKVALSYIFPITAVKYVLTPLLAVLWLRESITANNALGVLVILAGMWLAYR